MFKGLSILVATFAVVGILQFLIIRLSKLSETKNSHYRKFFWYIYGIIFMLSGGVNLIEKGEFHWSFTFQFIIGLITLILNALGKLDKQIKEPNA